MNVNVQTIKQDIITTKYEIFLLEFPNLKLELETFKKSPNCGGCVQGLFSKLFSYPDFEQKMKLIYGDDVVVDKTLPKPPIIMLVNEVFKIPIEEYDSWMKSFVDLRKNIKIFTTFYVPEERKVWVTVSIITQQVQ
jgi:hypothetical protein